MTLNRIGPNVLTITCNNGDEILFSYNAPVAARIGRKYMRIDSWISRTTAQHVETWLKYQRIAAAKETFKVSAATLETIVKSAC